MRRISIGERHVVNRSSVENISFAGRSQSRPIMVAVPATGNVGLAHPDYQPIRILRERRRAVAV